MWYSIAWKDKPWFVYLFICWTFVFFPPGFLCLEIKLQEAFVCKLLCGHIFPYSLGWIARRGMAELLGKYILNLLRNCSNSSHEVVAFYIPLISVRGSALPSSPALGTVSLFNVHRPNRCGVLSPWGFNLHFPMSNDVEHLLCLSFLYLYWWRVCLNIFPTFKSLIVALLVILLLGCNRSLCILDTSSLSSMYFANIFSQSVSCHRGPCGSLRLSVHVYARVTV